MKYIFIVLSFFTLTMPLMAQEQIRYIVNLPPLSIYHDNLTIMRKGTNNFIPGDTTTPTFDTLNKSTGALILGANNDKTIKIYKTNNSNSNTIDIEEIFADGSLIFGNDNDNNQQFKEITIDSITNTDEGTSTETQDTYMTNANITKVDSQINEMYVKGVTNITNTNFLPTCNGTIHWKQIRLKGSDECRAFLVCGGGDDVPDCKEPPTNN